MAYVVREAKGYGLSVAGKQQRRKRKNMKISKKNKEVNEMRKEYDFSGGVRGKHFEAYRKGHTVKIFKQDGSIEVNYFTGKSAECPAL